MLTMILAMASLFSHPTGDHVYPVGTRRYADAGWNLEIRRDRFSDRTACSLHGRRMSYQSGAIGFATHAREGISTAWYRIDGSAPRPWGDLYPELHDAGVRLEIGGIDDPTAGILWMPLRLVGASSEVSIETEARGRRRVARFRLRGFAAIRDAALRLGCPADGFAI